MSRHINQHMRDSKPQFSNIKDFNYSVDIKKFSRDRGNMTPLNHHTSNIYKKLQQRSNQKIRNSQPSSLAISFSKNISQKNMKTKRKLSSVQIIKTNHHSVSIDHHLLNQKYNVIRENFESAKYQKVIPMIRNIVLHFQYSNTQKNLYFWLAVSLGSLHRYEEAIEELTECLTLYPSFEEGLLFNAQMLCKIHNYKLAVQNIQEAIKINSKNQEAYMQLAICYKALKQRTKEKDLLKTLVDRYPKEGVFLLLLVQCLLNLRETTECETYLSKYCSSFPRTDSTVLYLRGLFQRQKGNIQESYILFQESLKYNSNRIAVNRSLLEKIKIEIEKRDFYQAHHSVGRIKFLQLQETQQIKIYSIFIEGVMTMMKKKSQQAIDILLPIAKNKKCKELKIQNLTYKYLAYGYFKIGQYSQSIKYYQKIPKQQSDESSLYNKLLAEGIQLADRRYSFTEAVAKFNKAKSVYPQKVEPYLYIAMVHILKYNCTRGKDQMKKAEVLIEALKEMELAWKLNPNSSNLLYHRTIIHLYFQDWDQALDDINRCIQKAQQNLPKYFYLRGVCYSCVKDFKKAVNQFSICLSLDQDYQQAHFQKAKCYFLLGNTQKGFNSLKYFIELNPDDLSIYKWIGDLLYEGKSYQDALKAYDELIKQQTIQILLMKAKCQFRVASMPEVFQTLKSIEKIANVDKNKIHLDITAFNLLSALLKPEPQKIILSLITKLNKLIEQNSVGYLFQLIDCMNLLGVASFYLHKYSDAYESFLLVLELYQSISEKQSVMVKAQQCNEELDLRSQDIYFNIIICQLARNRKIEAIKMIKQEFRIVVSSQKEQKKIERLIGHIEKENAESFEWEFKHDKPNNNKFKRIEIDCGKLKLKTKPVFNLYHENAENLYSSEVADKMIKQLHTGYIDSMPEGPWIKRNPYGVVFTQDMMPSENSISLGDTFRRSESEFMESVEDSEVQEEKKTISKKQEFLKKLKFDEKVQAKLNRMIKGDDKNK